MLDHGHEGEGPDRLYEMAVEVGSEGSQIVGTTPERRECDDGKASEPGEPQVSSQAARELDVDHRHLDVAKHNIRVDRFNDIKGGTSVGRGGDAGALVLKQALRSPARPRTILD
jgi:hypothetical protein